MEEKHRKHSQLGMNSATASHRLVKDLLFKLVVEGGHTCYRCGLELTRESFSIDHKIPWLDSEKPTTLFFDLDNVAFSHLACNSGAARRKGFKCGTESSYTNGCRCDDCRIAATQAHRERYNPE